MGNCGAAPISPEKYRVNRKLDAELAHQNRLEEEKIKLLLLGAGESGKSTIFKQMKVIYGTQYSEAECRQQIPTIYSNILHAIKVLLKQLKTFGYLSDMKCEKAEYENILAIHEDTFIDEQIGMYM